MTICRASVALIVAVLGLARPVGAVADTAQAQVTLECKFPEGQRLSYRTTSRARQLLRFMGVDVESVKRETKDWSRSIGKRRDDARLPIEEKVQNLRVEYTLAGGIKLTFDSTKPPTKVDHPQLAFLGDVFQFERAIAYTVVLDKANAVMSVEGAETLRKKAEQLPYPIAREELQSEVDAERLKRKFEQSIHVLPGHPVHPGETWERAELLDINGKTLAVRKKYEYRGTEKKADKTLEKISCKVLDVKYDPGSAATMEKLPLKITKNDLKVDSSDGMLLFDREQGHVVSARERIRIKGEVNYSGAGVDQKSEFDLSFDSDTQLQPSAK